MKPYIVYLLSNVSRLIILFLTNNSYSGKYWLTKIQYLFSKINSEYCFQLWSDIIDTPLTNSQCPLNATRDTVPQRHTSASHSWAFIKLWLGAIGTNPGRESKTQLLKAECEITRNNMWPWWWPREAPCPGSCQPEWTALPAAARMSTRPWLLLGTMSGSVGRKSIPDRGNSTCNIPTGAWEQSPETGQREIYWHLLHFCLKDIRIRYAVIRKRKLSLTFTHTRKLIWTCDHANTHTKKWQKS